MFERCFSPLLTTVISDEPFQIFCDELLGTMIKIDCAFANDAVSALEPDQARSFAIRQAVGQDFGEFLS